MSNDEVKIWNKMDDNEKNISGDNKFDHSEYFEKLINDSWNETSNDEPVKKADKEDDITAYFKRVKKELLERSKDE